MKRTHIVIKCSPSGDVYELGTPLTIGAIQYTIHKLLDRALEDHDIFESYKIDVNPVPEA